MKNFLIEKKGRLLEMVSAQDIEKLLKERKISLSHRIYDDQNNKWIQILEHPIFQSLQNKFDLKSIHQLDILEIKPRVKQQVPGYNIENKPTVAQQTLGRNIEVRSILAQQIPEEEIKQWYFLQGQAPVGPFSYLEMIKLLQTKKIQKTTTVWRQGIIHWMPLFKLREFHSSTLGDLIKKRFKQAQNFICRRKYKRFPYAAKFVLHNEQELWRAVSVELSAGGIGLLANTASLNVGQEVFIHKTSGGSSIQINAVAVIVSKSLNGMRPGQARYGLEFIDISRESQKEIAQFCSDRIQEKISR